MTASHFDIDELVADYQGTANPTGLSVENINRAILEMHRCGLRAVWAAQRVRAEYVESADGELSNVEFRQGKRLVFRVTVSQRFSRCVGLPQ